MFNRQVITTAILCTTVVAVGCGNGTVLIDSDGNQYGTVRIGQQTWMTENLRLDVGDGSYCYDDNTAKCLDMGRLYSWEAATRAASRIHGWHLPSQEEWLALIESAGPDSVAYEAITSTEFGFSPQWSGVRLAGSGEYRAMELRTVNYWSSTASQEDSTLAWSVAIMSNLRVISPHNYPRVNACSVRLIKDH